MAQTFVAECMIIDLVEKEIANILREEKEKAKLEELERRKVIINLDEGR